MRTLFVHLLLLLGAALLTPELATAEDIEVTLFGDDAYPPYSYVENGTAQGIYPDILREVEKRMHGFSFKLDMKPWRRVLKGAERGEVLAIFPPYLRPQERRYLSTYSVPVLAEETVVFCNNRILNTPRPAWPRDYHGLTIGNNLSFATGGTEFYKAVSEGHIRLDEIYGTDLNVRKLLGGRIDCYINDRIAILWTIKNEDRGDYLFSGKLKEGAVISREHGYIAYSAHFDADYKPDFIKRFNQIILSLKADGVIDSIVRSYTE